MIDETKNDILGNKVFFLYPTQSIQNQIISELIQQEYEAYVAKDHSRLLRALKNYDKSIVYINIDEGMTAPEWEKWISGISTPLPDIRIGVFSTKTEDGFKEKYLNMKSVTCGFIHLKVDMSNSIDGILKTLEEMNIKGRRKYLRASAERDTKATMNLPHNEEYINGTIKDISVVGFSCVLERDPDMKKNTLCSNIQIRLQSTLLKVDAIVLGSRDNGGEKMYVMLFAQRTDPETRVKIRKYIQQNLQAIMDNEINL